MVNPDLNGTTAEQLAFVNAEIMKISSLGQSMSSSQRSVSRGQLEVWMKMRNQLMQQLALENGTYGVKIGRVNPNI
jgi:hypothetical protein